MINLHQLNSFNKLPIHKTASQFSYIRSFCFNIVCLFPCLVKYTNVTTSTSFCKYSCMVRTTIKSISCFGNFKTEMWVSIDCRIQQTKLKSIAANNLSKMFLYRNKANICFVFTKYRSEANFLKQKLAVFAFCKGRSSCFVCPESGVIK